MGGGGDTQVEEQLAQKLEGTREISLAGTKVRGNLGLRSVLTGVGGREHLNTRADDQPCQGCQGTRWRSDHTGPLWLSLGEVRWHPIVRLQQHSSMM